MTHKYDNSSAAQSRILIDGYYGVGNVGDEAILACVLNQVRECFEAPNVIVSSENPSHTIKYHDVDSAVERFRILGSKRDWISAVKEADILILGGGGLFSLTSYTTYCLKVLLARLFSTDVHIVSMGGAEPAKGWLQMRQLSFLLACSDSISVRDEETQAVFKRANPDVKVQKLSDIVYSMELSDSEGVSASDERLVVCVREPKSRSFDYPYLCDAIESLYEHHKPEILFIPFNQNCNPPDGEVAKRIVSRLDCPVEVCSETFTWEQAADLISRSEMVVAMRLHSIIISAKMRTKFVGISYEAKCDAQLKALGIEDPIRSDELDEAGLESELDTMWRQEGISRRINSRTEVLEANSQDVVPYLRRVGTNPPAISSILGLLAVTVVGLIADMITMATGRFNE